MGKRPQGPPCPGIDYPLLSPIEVLAHTGISDPHCHMVILNLPLGSQWKDPLPQTLVCETVKRDTYCLDRVYMLRLVRSQEGWGE